MEIISNPFFEFAIILIISALVGLVGLITIGLSAYMILFPFADAVGSGFRTVEN